MSPGGLTSAALGFAASVLLELEPPQAASPIGAPSASTVAPSARARVLIFCSPLSAGFIGVALTLGAGRSTAGGMEVNTR